MRSCSLLRRILPVAFIFTLPILSTADNRHLEQDIPSLLVTEDDQENSSDFGFQSANILLNVIERILDRLESSAVPPQQDNHESAPETSWPPLENNFVQHDLIYLPKSSSQRNTLALGIASYGKSRQRGFSPCNKGFCRSIRGRKAGNANAGARMLPFGKRDSNLRRNSDESGTSSVRGRRRGRGRPRSRGSFPTQNKLPFGKRRL